MSELDMPTGWLKLTHHPRAGWGYHFDDHVGNRYVGRGRTRRGAIRAARKQLHQITTKETTKA